MNSTRGTGTSHRPGGPMRQAFRRLWIMVFVWATTTCVLAMESIGDPPGGDASTTAAPASDTTGGAAATTVADTSAPDTTPVADTVMPRPKALERDVQFWVRVYTQVDTNGGFLHDQYNLSVIYETLHFSPNTSPRE